MTSRWHLVVPVCAAVFLAGCAGPVDTDGLPGTYREERTGAELRLGPDGTFTATGVSTGVSPGPADFSGRWEFVDRQASSDFVYLSVEDGGLGMIDGIQLYPSGRNSVEFIPDPDGKPLPKLSKVSEP